MRILAISAKFWYFGKQIKFLNVSHFLHFEHVSEKPFLGHCCQHLTSWSKKWTKVPKVGVKSFLFEISVNFQTCCHFLHLDPFWNHLDISGGTPYLIVITVIGITVVIRTNNNKTKKDLHTCAQCFSISFFKKLRHLDIHSWNLLSVSLTKDCLSSSFSASYSSSVLAFSELSWECESEKTCYILVQVTCCWHFWERQRYLLRRLCT